MFRHTTIGSSLFRRVTSQSYPTSSMFPIPSSSYVYNQYDGLGILQAVHVVLRRWMSGGDRPKGLHSKFLHKSAKHRLILRYCDQLFGVTSNATEGNIDTPVPKKNMNSKSKNKHEKFRQTTLRQDPLFQRRVRPDRWISLPTLLFANVFRGWTNYKTLVEAFETSQGRYELREVSAMKKTPSQATTTTRTNKQQSKKKFKGQGSLPLLAVRVNRDHPLYSEGRYDKRAIREYENQYLLKRQQSGRDLYTTTIKVPQIRCFEIPSDQVGKVIGTGGQQIRTIIRNYGLRDMNVKEDGTIQMSGFDDKKLEEAEEFVEKLVSAQKHD